jgi:hypothetical protein
MSVMNRLMVIVTVMLVVTALYYMVTTVFKPSQPQVIVVKPSGGQGGQSTAGSTAAPETPPPPVGGQYLCPKTVYLKVAETSICADVVYAVVRAEDGSLQVDFQGGIVSGVFTFASAPCAVTTTPQGILIPCRAQIVIPVKR